MKNMIDTEELTPDVINVLTKLGMSEYYILKFQEFLLKENLLQAANYDIDVFKEFIFEKKILLTSVSETEASETKQLKGKALPNVKSLTKEMPNLTTTKKLNTLPLGVFSEVSKYLNDEETIASVLPWSISKNFSTTSIEFAEFKFPALGKQGVTKEQLEARIATRNQNEKTLLKILDINSKALYDSILAECIASNHHISAIQNLIASKLPKIESVTEFLAQNEDVCTASALLVAVKKQMSHKIKVVDLVKLLLERASNNLHIKNQEGDTVLHLAINSSNELNKIELVKILIGAGADVKQPNQKEETALHLAINSSNELNKIELVKILIDAGADVNKKNKAGDTALLCALEMKSDDNKIELVKILIDAGADGKVGDDGKTPLALIVSYLVKSIAPNNEAYETGKEAYKAKKEADKTNKEAYKIIETLLERNVDVNAALHLAIEYGHRLIHDSLNSGFPMFVMDIIKKLIQAQPNFNVPYTALELALQKGYNPVTKLLIDAGASPETVQKALTLAKQLGYPQNKIQDIFPSALGEDIELIAPEVVQDSQMPNISDSKELINHSILSNACIFGRIDIIKRFINEYKKYGWTAINRSQYDNGNTALHLATIYGHEEIVQIIIDATGSLSDNNNRNTALHLATIYGHEKIVQIITDTLRDTKCDSPNEDCNTALHFAIMDNRPKIAQMIIDTSNEYTSYYIPNNAGYTPLKLALKYKHGEIVKMLMHSHAKGGFNFIEDVKEILSEAIEAGNISTLELLIKAGANLEWQDDDGEFNFNEDVNNILRKAIEDGNISTLELLIKAGASTVNFIEDVKEILSEAIDAGNQEIVKMILDAQKNAGIDIDASDKDVSSALVYALSQDSINIDIVRMLLEECPQNDINTLLFGAINEAKQGIVQSERIAQILIQVGVNINVKNSDGNTPLHLAVGGSSALISLLIQVGANINVKNSDGNTPLMLAIASNDNQNAILLLPYCDLKNLSVQDFETLIKWAPVCLTTDSVKYLVEMREQKTSEANHENTLQDDNGHVGLQELPMTSEGQNHLDVNGANGLSDIS
jgi:ankyrin repeat protein